MLIIDGVTVRILKEAAATSLKMLRIYGPGDKNKKLQVMKTASRAVI
jgi:hypothetical protein